jgi:hypothetical protein
MNNMKKAICIMHKSLSVASPHDTPFRSPEDHEFELTVFYPNLS